LILLVPDAEEQARLAAIHAAVQAMMAVHHQAVHQAVTRRQVQADHRQDQAEQNLIRLADIENMDLLARAVGNIRMVFTKDILIIT